jgi:hypothetical protein
LCLVDRGPAPLAGKLVLGAHEQISLGRPHRMGCEDRPGDDEVRVALEENPILERARYPVGSIDDHDARPLRPAYRPPPFRDRSLHGHQQATLGHGVEDLVGRARKGFLDRGIDTVPLGRGEEV